MILLRPVDTRFPITQRFGENPELYPLTGGHMGIDYGLAEGSEVRAAADGEVLRAGLDAQSVIDPRTGYGIYVKLQHGDGSQTIYGHLCEAVVRVGQLVQLGQVIGHSGNTGRSTGPHLHFELRTGRSGSLAIDPAPFLVDGVEDGGLLQRTLPRGRERPARAVWAVDGAGGAGLLEGGANG